MTKEAHESVSSTKNKSWWVKSFIKKATAPLIAAALLASCSSSNGSTQPETKMIQIGQWATLS